MKMVCPACWLLGIAFLLTQSTIAAEGESPSRKESLPITSTQPLTRPLRVITANIWNYAEPYQKRMKVLRDQIREIDPDLIGFQEAGFTPGQPHQVEELLKGLDYHIDHQYAGANVKQRSGTGVAVASRWPITRKGMEKLFDGKVLAVEVEGPAPMGKFMFYATFGTTRWRFDRELDREKDALALDSYVRNTADRSGFPPIIAGDFDATPESACIRFLMGKQSLQGRQTHYYDAWAFANRDNKDPGYTWSNQNPYVARFTRSYLRDYNHHRRIDYVFVGSPFHYKGYARIVGSRVVLNKPHDDVWPSDHFGVLAKIAVAPQE